MMKVIGVIYLIQENDIDLTLTCSILEEALGYSDHKIKVQKFSPYWQVCEKLVSEGIMKETKTPLTYVLNKRGLHRIIKIDTKGRDLFTFYIRRITVEGDKAN